MRAATSAHDRALTLARNSSVISRRVNPAACACLIKQSVRSESSP